MRSYAYHRGAGPAAQYPQDIKRLQRTLFQLQGSAADRSRLTANLNANVFTLAREVGVPVVQHLVGNDLSPPLSSLDAPGCCGQATNTSTASGSTTRRGD